MSTAGPPAGTPGTTVDAVPGVLGVDLGPGVRAGFTVRGSHRGTRSGTPSGSLRGADHSGSGSYGLGVGEDPGPVLERRRALAGWAGTPLTWVTQVHGTGVLVRSGPTPVPGTGTGAGTGPGAPGRPVAEADAIVVGRGAGAAVVVADCVPVLLADPVAGVAAAVHAGRRGLLDGVVGAAVDAMVAAGARPDRVRAAVGPAICGRCYEVPAAMRDEVADVVPGVASRTSWGTPALDLPAGVVTVLAHAGVTAVQGGDWCTHTDVRFFSHRRSTRTGEPAGRCAAVVALEPGPPDRGAGVSDPGGSGGRC